jgi:hypothetical protein
LTEQHIHTQCHYQALAQHVKPFNDPNSFPFQAAVLERIIDTMLMNLSGCFLPAQLPKLLSLAFQLLFSVQTRTS